MKATVQTEGPRTVRQEPQITPISGLVDNATDYFESVVLPAIELACASPASKSTALSAFILLHHTKDWAKLDGVIASEGDLWLNCPYAEVIAEIANGGKHRVVNDRHLVADPKVLDDVMVWTTSA